MEALAGSADEASIEPVTWEGQQYRLDIAATERQRLRQSRRARSRACDRSRCDASRARTTARHRYRRIERDSIHSRRIESAGGVVVRFQTSTGVTPEPRRCGRRGRAACAQLRSQSEPRSWNPAGSGSRCRSSRLRLRNDERRCPCARGMGDAETNRQAQCAVAHRRARPLGSTSPPRLSRSGESTPHRHRGHRCSMAPRPGRSRLSVALMDPRAMRNDDLDAIAGAIARGRHRVDELAAGDGDVNAVAREIAMDGWRVRALRWSLRHEPQRARSWFSMTELLYLGGGRGTDLHAWGMSAIDVTGCICARLTAPGLVDGTRWPARAQAADRDRGRSESAGCGCTVRDACAGCPRQARPGIRGAGFRRPRSVASSRRLADTRACRAGPVVRPDRGLRLRGRGRGSAGYSDTNAEQSRVP